MMPMFIYPKILRKKDLKKISKYPCNQDIKDAYTKYLTNYSFNEFVDYCEENAEKDMDDLIFKFTDLQLEKFEPNSLIWVSHVMINFMIYFNVNLDYGEYYDAYASALQLSVLSCAMKMAIDKLQFDEVPFPPYCEECFERLFAECLDFKYDLEKDCILAYNSFPTTFDFTDKEFCLKVNEFFEKKDYFNKNI